MGPGLDLPGGHGGAEAAGLGGADAAVEPEPVPTRITLSTGAFLTQEVKTLDETTAPPARLTNEVVFMTPFSPSTTRESPLIFTVTNEVSLSALLMVPRTAEWDTAESVAENEVMAEIGLALSAR